MSEPIRIAVIDDHPVVRDGLIAMLSTQPDLAVVGEANDGLEAIRVVAQHHPDVVLLDLEMPGMDGVEVLQRLQAERPDVRVIVFTAFDSDERIVSALQAGAKGYLLKGVPRNDLFEAIRVVHQGGSLLQPVVASKLLEHMRKPAATNLPEALTEREHEVLDLLAQGKANKEIAAALVITERTVKFHISSIMGKLGAANRTEVVSIAVQQGLIEL